MDISLKYNNIRASLLNWYEDNKRDLPWRNTTNPYIIWISEIILQQTRVDQGYDYFTRFILRFPNTKSLAESDEEDVLKLWQGLGYYSRARNIHAAAKDIINRFEGNFPTNYKDILSLKGIGEYTAAAIASFAYKLPHAVVDGNVYRVLSRLFGVDTPIDTTIGKKTFANLAQDLLNTQEPDVHNQAIMELGALQCTPTNPVCVRCPLSEYCVAYNTNRVNLYPVKQGKTKVKERFFNYIDIRYNGYMYLKKRTGNDVWKNLYELPLIETDKAVEWDELIQSANFKALFKVEKYVNSTMMPIKIKHILSHRIIYACFYRIELSEELPSPNDYLKIKTEDLHLYPISRLVDRYFETTNSPDLFS